MPKLTVGSNNTVFVVVQEFRDVFGKEIEYTEEVERFNTQAEADVYLVKRDYVFDKFRNQWFRGNAQFPVNVEKRDITPSLFDIKSFV